MSKRNSFALWMIAGLLFAFAGFAILSIGWLLLIVAVIVAVVVVRKGSTWPEILGLLAGAGVSALWVGFAHWQRCASSSRAVIYHAGSNERMDGPDAIVAVTGGGCISSIDYRFWMLGGLALLVAGLVAYWAICRQARAQSGR